MSKLATACVFRSTSIHQWTCRATVPLLVPLLVPVRAAFPPKATGLSVSMLNADRAGYRSSRCIEVRAWLPLVRKNARTRVWPAGMFPTTCARSAANRFPGSQLGRLQSLALINTAAGGQLKPARGWPGTRASGKIILRLCHRSRQYLNCFWYNQGCSQTACRAALIDAQRALDWR